MTAISRRSLLCPSLCRNLRFPFNWFFFSWCRIFPTKRPSRGGNREMTKRSNWITFSEHSRGPSIQWPTFGAQKLSRSRRPVSDCTRRCYERTRQGLSNFPISDLCSLRPQFIINLVSLICGRDKTSSLTGINWNSWRMYITNITLLRLLLLLCFVLFCELLFRNDERNRRLKIKPHICICSCYL